MANTRLLTAPSKDLEKTSTRTLSYAPKPNTETSSWRWKPVSTWMRPQTPVSNFAHILSTATVSVATSMNLRMPNKNNTGGVYDEHGTRGFISPFIPCHWIQKKNYKQLMEKHGEAVRAFQTKNRGLFKKRGWNKIVIRLRRRQSTDLAQ